MSLAIKDRILAAYRPGISYYDLIHAVFPDNQYPRAFRHAPGGGPPGCAMAFGNALKKMGAWIDYMGNRAVFIPRKPRKK